MNTDEDFRIDLIDELWDRVEEHKDEGPGPVLRALADRVLQERDEERDRIIGYLERQGVISRHIDAIRRGAHRH